MPIEGFVESDRLPRDLAPGLIWLGVCTAVHHGPTIVHSYHSLYLLSGATASAIVDTGNPKDWAGVERQLDRLLYERQIPPIRYILPTHSEVPHAGNLARLLRKFPEAHAIGDVRDLHLAFPRFSQRLEQAAIGDVIDLGGGRTYTFVPAFIRDLVTSLWGYDGRAQALFTGDGLAYMHDHTPAQCGLAAEEMPDLPLGEFAAIFNSYALYWTRFTDLRPHFHRMEEFLRGHPTRIIAPGHGSPILSPAATIPKFRDELLSETEVQSGVR
jgi:flavorubredoxin